MKPAKITILSLMLALMMMFLFAACENSDTHEGEAQTPSSAQKGRHYQDVIDAFKEQGFTNIKTEVLDDLILGWLRKDGEVKSVSVDGDEDYSPDHWYPHDVEIVITYHTFPSKEQSPEPTAPSPTEQNVPQPDNDAEAAKKALELTFPIENAKRAAIVAITNSGAIDVFEDDGNTYDVSKFHSYADTSGNFLDYYINVNEWGIWSVKDEQTWRVDSLIYENSWGTVFNALLDVNYDGTNYIVSNMTKTFGNPEDPSKYGEENDTFTYTISPELIKDDRSQTKISSYHDWVNSQFSIWDGSHEMLKELIIENLNDEKSFKHIETTYQVIFAEEIKDEVNKVLKSEKKNARVEIGDLWITTEFSAKNAFNATIKNTAYGIASFSTDIVTLVAIE